MKISNKSLWCSVGMALAIAFTISPIPNIIATALNIPFVDKIIMPVCLIVLFTIRDYLKKQNLKYIKTLIVLGFIVGIISGVVTGDVYFTF